MESDSRCEKKLCGENGFVRLEKDMSGISEKTRRFLNHSASHNLKRLKSGRSGSPARSPNTKPRLSLHFSLNYCKTL